MLGINIDAVYAKILGKMDETWLAHGYGVPFGLSVSALCATSDREHAYISNKAKQL